jgi:eukaryotic-like serine/threonine-protein kinase
MKVVCGHCHRDFAYTGERPRFCGHCGQALETECDVPSPTDAVTLPPDKSAPVSSSNLPTAIGGFKIIRRIGGGGMGSVYEAEDPSSGQHVAIKLIQAELMHSEGALQRFRQEGQLASALSHPRSVFVLGADEDNGRPYIVMELMPGTTLEDLVREQGPLPPEQAILKILDVIDGLEAAHQLGLIHRDVKPSNCFLETNGRVKVGDFGLVKSRKGDSHLTRTGTFLGTPLYAAPEQIKCEGVDAQSDVYSVAATLYFLLTGRAPFQSGDSMATLARIVSEEPPPMRSVRPSLARSLDKVVLRGLERNRRRRWQSLDELRNALVAFLPAKPSIGGMGLRFGAYMIDYVAVSLVQQAIAWCAFYPLITSNSVLLFATQLSILPIYFLNYGVMEGIYGWSIGKRLLRLRVGTMSSIQPPGLNRGLLRAGIFFALLRLGPFLTQFVALLFMDDTKPDEIRIRVSEFYAAVALVFFSVVWPIVGLVLIVLPMRSVNGFRGAHEFLSSTRTYRMSWPHPFKRAALVHRPHQMQVTQPPGLPAAVGDFEVRGALRSGDREALLLAEDPQLSRPVLIWLRPSEEPAVPEAERTVSRTTRLRWLACGTEGTYRYDAYVAPSGSTLPALVTRGGPLSWSETRPIVEDLLEELSAAAADGTLPKTLSIEQVWLQPSGRAQLFDGACGESRLARERAGVTDQVLTLSFVRDVVVTALEGRSRQAVDASAPVRALLPVHAEKMLNRLVGSRDPYTSVDQLAKELEATRDRPILVTMTRRTLHLALMTLVLNIPLCGMLVIPLAACLPPFGLPRQVGAGSYLTIAVCVAFWVVWAFVFRGGFAFKRGGIGLRRADGRKPSRLQCGLRALLVWSPIAAVFCLAVFVRTNFPDLPVVFWFIWALGCALPIVFGTLAICMPNRSIHDRIAGTYLVPD